MPSDILKQLVEVFPEHSLHPDLYIAIPWGDRKEFTLVVSDDAESDEYVRLGLYIGMAFANGTDPAKIWEQIPRYLAFRLVDDVTDLHQPGEKWPEMLQIIDDWLKINKVA